MVTTAEPQRPPSRTAEVQRRNRCRTALASGPTQTHGGLLRERSAMSARRVFELVAACSRALPQLICPLTTPHDSPMNRNFTERDKRSTAPAFAFANTNRSAVNRCHLTTPCRSTHPFDCLFLFPLPPFLPSLAPIARATVFLDRVRDIGRRHARMRVVLGVLSRKDTPRYAVRKVPQRGACTPFTALRSPSRSHSRADLSHGDEHRCHVTNMQTRARSHHQLHDIVDGITQMQEMPCSLASPCFVMWVSKGGHPHTSLRPAPARQREACGCHPLGPALHRRR
jgi:hypothetical protein